MNNPFNDQSSSSHQNQNSQEDPLVPLLLGDKSSVNAQSQHKNKYIIKMREIGVEERGTRESCSAISVDKKERNKFSAKQSRDRKKLYIEILEERQKTLAKQLESRKKELQETKGYLQRVVSQNKTMSGFTESRHLMMKKIQSLLELAKKGEDPSAQLNEIIDSLRYRIGATGHERINTINEYFRQIVNLSLPALHRYMMWSAAEGRHLFGSHQEEEDEWFVELRDALNLSEEQKKEILSKREFLREQKALLQKLVGDLKEIKGNIQEKSEQLQTMIDGIRDILTPQQSAHFILFIEKNKYRKELNLCEATIDQDEPALRKAIKGD